MKTPTHESIVWEIIWYFGLCWAGLMIADKLGFELEPGLLWLPMVLVLIGPIYATAGLIESQLDMMMAGIEGTYRNRDERWWA